MKTFLIIIFCIIIAPYLFRAALHLLKLAAGIFGTIMFIVGLVSCFTDFSMKNIVVLLIGVVLNVIAFADIDFSTTLTDADIMSDIALKEEKEENDRWWQEHWDYKDRYRDD